MSCDFGISTYQFDDDRHIETFLFNPLFTKNIIQSQYDTAADNNNNLGPSNMREGLFYIKTYDEKCNLTVDYTNSFSNYGITLNVLSRNNIINTNRNDLIQLNSDSILYNVSKTGTFKSGIFMLIYQNKINVGGSNIYEFTISDFSTANGIFFGSDTNAETNPSTKTYGQFLYDDYSSSSTQLTLQASTNYPKLDTNIAYGEYGKKNTNTSYAQNKPSYIWQLRYDNNKKGFTIQNKSTGRYLKWLNFYDSTLVYLGDKNAPIFNDVFWNFEPVFTSNIYSINPTYSALACKYWKRIKSNYETFVQQNGTISKNDNTPNFAGTVKYKTFVTSVFCYISNYKDPFFLDGIRKFAIDYANSSDLLKNITNLCACGINESYYRNTVCSDEILVQYISSDEVTQQELLRTGFLDKRLYPNVADSKTYRQLASEAIGCGGNNALQIKPYCNFPTCYNNVGTNGNINFLRGTDTAASCGANVVCVQIGNFNVYGQAQGEFVNNQNQQCGTSQLNPNTIKDINVTYYDSQCYWNNDTTFRTALGSSTGPANNDLGMSRTLRACQSTQSDAYCSTLPNWSSCLSLSYPSTNGAVIDNSYEYTIPITNFDGIVGDNTSKQLNINRLFTGLLNKFGINNTDSTLTAGENILNNSISGLNIITITPTVANNYSNGTLKLRFNQNQLKPLILSTNNISPTNSSITTRGGSTQFKVKATKRISDRGSLSYMWQYALQSSPNDFNELTQNNKPQSITSFNTIIDNEGFSVLSLTSDNTTSINQTIIIRCLIRDTIASNFITEVTSNQATYSVNYTIITTVSPTTTTPPTSTTTTPPTSTTTTPPTSTTTTPPTSSRVPTFTLVQPTSTTLKLKPNTTINLEVYNLQNMSGSGASYKWQVNTTENFETSTPATITDTSYVTNFTIPLNYSFNYIYFRFIATNSAGSSSSIIKVEIDRELPTQTPRSTEAPKESNKTLLIAAGAVAVITIITLIIYFMKAGKTAATLV